MSVAVRLEVDDYILVDKEDKVFVQSVIDEARSGKRGSGYRFHPQAGVVVEYKKRMTPLAAIIMPHNSGEIVRPKDGNPRNMCRTNLKVWRVGRD